MAKAETGKKQLGLVGAIVSAAGIIALESVAASGAALGALVEGFKAAGQTVKDALAKQETESAEQMASTEELEVAAEDTAGSVANVENDDKEIHEAEVQS